MFALKEGCPDHFVCKWGGLRPPQPPRFLKAIDGCAKGTGVGIYVCAKGILKAIDGCKEKEQASGFMLALKEGCADHFVCNWGGLRPPQLPRFLKAIDGCKKRTALFATGGKLPPTTPPLFKGHRWLQRKRTSVSIYVCAKGRLCRSFCLQLGGGGLRPPQPPRFLKAIDGCKEKEQASGFMLALKEGCADHFVCNWGGAAPPPTPPLFKGHRWLHKKNKRRDLCLR